MVEMGWNAKLSFLISDPWLAEASFLRVWEGVPGEHMVHKAHSVPTYCIEKHDSDGIVRTYDNLPLLYLHGSIQRVQQVARFHVFIERIVA
jgi:hypothetical protein